MPTLPCAKSHLLTKTHERAHNSRVRLHSIRSLNVLSLRSLRLPRGDQVGGPVEDRAQLEWQKTLLYKLGAIACSCATNFELFLPMRHSPRCRLKMRLDGTDHNLDIQCFTMKSMHLGKKHPSAEWRHQFERIHGRQVCPLRVGAI